MDKEAAFDHEISEIYRLSHSLDAVSAQGGAPLNIRHSEFQAMAETFLGQDYDPVRLEKVEALQIELRNRQNFLLQEYENNRLDAESYVDSVNDLLSSTFFQCETILGKIDFESLFGAPRDELAGFIDKETFLALQSSEFIDTVSPNLMLSQQCKPEANLKNLKSY